MGRKKKYLTQESKQEAQLAWSKLYYIRNKEIIDKKAKEKYHERKKSNNL